ncbi:unnamed protein product [Rotaria sp. Silwood1]|nr:unnamed protein product [Rotaria sp. Silwood1]
MNMTTKSPKTPSQDAQGRWGDLLSPTQVLTGHEPTTSVVSKIKKKQPRNRKLQRYCRKLRKQGVDKATIQMYERTALLEQQDASRNMDMEQTVPLNDTQKLPGPYNPERKTTKRKRDESTKQDGQYQDTSMSKSFSQLSMKENSKKKKKRSSSSSKTQEQPKEQQQQEEDENKVNIVADTVNKQARSLHYYLNTNNKTFKQMLKSVVVDDDKKFLQWCKSKENFDYVREHTRLLDRVYYLKLEEDLWKNYLIYGETYRCWTSSLSKTIINDNKLEFDYKISKKSMEKYIEKIKQNKATAEGEVQKHVLLLKNYQQPNSNINEQRLWAALLALVRKGQKKLSQHYEHRKERLKNSAQDYSLVKACYDCQPTQDEIMFMQIIWQATMNECKSQQNVDILKQHLYMKRIPKSLDYLDQSFSNVEHTLARPIYNDNIRTTFTTRHKKIIAQNKLDLMTLYISMSEAATRGYHQYGEDEKNKLIHRMNHDSLRQFFVEPFIQAIEHRQKHIRQYMQYATKRRLHFFYHRSDDRRQNWYRRSYHLNLYWDILPSSPIIEVHLKLTPEQLALLSRGPKYVPPCQSWFYKKKKKEKIIDEEHKNIMSTITEFFRQHGYYISKKRIDEFSNDLKNLLLRLYTKKLSRKLSVRAKREHKLIMSIRRYLRKYQQVILRRTDKSKVFHLGDANDYQRQVLEYMQETEAYEEITSGVSPLSANLQQVTVVLNQLYHVEKPLITKKQYEAMYPKENETELAHLYFIPKPHKI